MILIAFSNKTSKILPRMFCRHWKHVAPIFVRADKLVMYQFVRLGYISKIFLNMRDINILKSYGWEFICVEVNTTDDVDIRGVFTCVQLVKRALGISNYWIQTPDAIYRHLKVNTILSIDSNIYK